MKIFKSAILALAVVAAAAGTLSFAQGTKPSVLSQREVNELFAGLVDQAETPQRKAALADFARSSPIQTKRQFLVGKIAIPYDDPAPRSDPPKDMLVQAQVPIGGLSCKHRRVCVKARCINLPGDVNYCYETSSDCTDYSSC